MSEPLIATPRALDDSIHDAKAGEFATICALFMVGVAFLALKTGHKRVLVEMERIDQAGVR